MQVECYDKKGAEVYELIIRQIFQDLHIGPSVDDLRAYADPDDVVFILAIKMKKTSSVTTLEEVARIRYDNTEDETYFYVKDENYLPNILKKLWSIFSREKTYQPNRYTIKIPGNQTEYADLVIDNPHSNLQKRIYDAVYRILPEGFKIIKDLSKGDIIAVVSTDELIKDAWLEKAYGYIDELKS